MVRRSLLYPVLVLAVLAGCHRERFVPAKFSSNAELFRASLRELQRHKWDNAVNGFERLTTELAARDPLLPLSYFYLGKAHDGRREWILAAQAFSRVPESFPDDTLADDATYEAGHAYSKLWRRPSLDPDYGITALSTFNSFLAAYPDSPLVPRVQAEIAHLTEWLARKEYENGLLYFKRKAYESSEIYFKELVQKYPQTPEARLALLRMAQLYDKIHYKEERQETCATLHQKYPNDHDVRDECGPPPPPTTSAQTKP